MKPGSVGLFGAVVSLALTSSCAASAGTVPVVPVTTPTASAAVTPTPQLQPSTPTVTATPSQSLAKLTDRQLAAAVLFGCTDARATTLQRSMARAGMAGIVLLGTNPPSDLKARLASVRRAAPSGRAPIIASDEEGGSVQRLGGLIYRLPSAESMGKWSAARLRSTARRYGSRMSHLGVNMSLAPVADLRVRGSYMDQLNRAFSAKPAHVGRDVIAWSTGLMHAGVAPVVKHWPGHGHAVDTHRFAARVPPLTRLLRADMVPFEMAVKAGVPAVMVAHVQARGLTADGVPATQSRHAMRILRRQVGIGTVVMTDSLSMAAASSARGLSESQAAIASLKAGTDWAMVCSTDPLGVVASVGRAIHRGDLSRAQLEDSAARIAALKEQYQR